MATQKLRLLHLSDLHEAGARSRAVWRRRRVLGEAFRQNLDELTADGTPVDLVCFTGDVAAAGLPAEYGWATDFVASVLEHLSLPATRFFVVPGNHDIQRDRAASAWRARSRACPVRS